MSTNKISSTQNSQHDVWISKSLSWLLRHGAIKEGLPISSDGFVAIADILNHKSFKSACSADDIKRVVSINNKQRFTIRTTEQGILEIKANQGHSIKEVIDLELSPITIVNHNTFENVIHGTYLKFWKFIKKEGLYRGIRTHIHFATGLPKDKNVISGMRQTAEVYIYIDLRKALTNGLLFFLSPNDVVLSPGNHRGYIEPKYFLKVYLASDGSALTY